MTCPGRVGWRRFHRAEGRAALLRNGLRGTAGFCPPGELTLRVSSACACALVLWVSIVNLLKIRMHRQCPLENPNAWVSVVNLLKIHGGTVHLCRGNICPRSLPPPQVCSAGRRFSVATAARAWRCSGVTVSAPWTASAGRRARKQQMSHEMWVLDVESPECLLPFAFELPPRLPTRFQDREPPARSGTVLESCLLL